MMDIGADTLNIIGIVVLVGIALAVLILRFHSEASADGRAFQSGMDDSRREMQRLAKGQSNVEGRVCANDRASRPGNPPVDERGGGRGRHFTVRSRDPCRNPEALVRIRSASRPSPRG